MKALVIGANGFAGRYLCNELRSHGYSVAAADRIESETVSFIDIMDMNSIQKLLDSEKPDIVYNLAGFPSVAESWKNPQAAVNLNVIGSINLLEAVKSVSKDIRIVLIGSSDQYGRVSQSDNPVNESHLLNPTSPYAISKRCQEDLGRTYSQIYDMDICMTRSFNHIGVGQRLGFVVSDFAYGISEIEKGNRSSLKVGNLSTKRCFTDVRDVASAYRLIGEKGIKGAVYNVGSDKIYSIKSILDILMSFSTVKIVSDVDSSKIRSFDVPYIQCDYCMLNQHTGWKPVYSIEETLLEILNYFRNNNVQER